MINKFVHLDIKLELLRASRKDEQQWKLKVRQDIIKVQIDYTIQKSKNVVLSDPSVDKKRLHDMREERNHGDSIISILF